MIVKTAFSLLTGTLVAAGFATSAFAAVAVTPPPQNWVNPATPCGLEICPSPDIPDPVPSRVQVTLTKPDGQVVEFNLNKRELAEMARLNGMQESQLLAKAIGGRVTKGQGIMAMDRLYQMLIGEFGGSWCGPCRMTNGELANSVKLPNGMQVSIREVFE